MNAVEEKNRYRAVRAWWLPAMWITLLVGGGLGDGTAAAQSSQQLPEIVERSIAFHGGESYADFQAELQLCSRSGCFDLQVREQGGVYDYTAAGASSGGHLKVRVTNDSVERWLDGESQAVDTEDEQRWRDWVSSKLYFCFLPYRLADPSVYFQDLSLEDWNGRQLHKVKVTFAPESSTDASDEYLYWFDPESARLEQFAYSFEGNPGGLRFRQGHNYRRAGELLFFDQHNLGVEGDQLHVDDLTPEMVADMRTVSEVECRDPKLVR